MTTQNLRYCTPLCSEEWKQHFYNKFLLNYVEKQRKLQFKFKNICFINNKIIIKQNN